MSCTNLFGYIYIYINYCLKSTIIVFDPNILHQDYVMFINEKQNKIKNNKLNLLGLVNYI